MQQWEYTTTRRSRELTPDGRAWGPWDPEDLDALLNKMGAQGWELVAVTARSDSSGGATGYDLSGATTSEVFVFKRPKA